MSGGPSGSGARSGLAVRGLSVGYRTVRGLLRVLDGVDLDIPPGTAVGLVGESGSGKSTLAYAIVRYLSDNARVLGGSVTLDGEELLDATDQRLRELRGAAIGMVYQDPAAALNPALRLGEQLTEGLRRHERLKRKEAAARGARLLDLVRLPDPEFIMRRYPHEGSGGEKQRVLIAMAFSGRPRLLVFDEPTTALDATTAAGILDLIRGLQEETGAAVLYITHDLGNVARVADRVNVIYAGRVVEEGRVGDVLRRPRHPYTRVLMASVPNPWRGGERRRLTSFAGLPPDLLSPPAGCIFQDRCPFVDQQCRTRPVHLPAAGDHRVACVRSEETAGRPLAPQSGRTTVRDDREAGAPLLRATGLGVEYGRRSLVEQVLRVPAARVHALTDVDLAIGRGETVGLVGESGCGKSTLARALVGLTAFRGTIRMGGTEIRTPVDMQDTYRRAVQIVFQHPDLSLNPRMTVGRIVGRPLQLYEKLSGKELDERVAGLLEEVRLPARYARRRPHELSGGEKQRVAVARAFGPRPALVICDEITSGLDVSVQASILNLLADLQDRLGTAYLFISHDLNLVQHFADRIVVMYLGRIVELRTTAGGRLVPPFHPYTEALLSAVPVPEPGLEARRVRLEGPLPSPKDPPPGCCFTTRCPRRPRVGVRPGAPLPRRGRSGTPSRLPHSARRARGRRAHLAARSASRRRRCGRFGYRCGPLTWSAKRSPITPPLTPARRSRGW